ncbi:MAG: hypothetical protein RMM58_08630 [Chloroflexota bacterium]|nr:hypothetical protein [Dehalococcoidia bacterium]MDW8253929.1 hypothetical protein [Chloroflexota bacterium]
MPRALRLNSDQAEQLKRAGLVILPLMTENNFAPISQWEERGRNSLLTDRRVQRALNYALNKEVVANDLCRSYAQPVGEFGFEPRHRADSLRPAAGAAAAR